MQQHITCVCVCVCDYFDNLDRGESSTVQEGKVVGSAWLDRKSVMIMSTNSQPSSTGTVLRRLRDGSRIQVQCPEAIIAYNKYMEGVWTMAINSGDTTGVG